MATSTIKKNISDLDSSAVNISSQIEITSSKGTISDITAKKYGKLIALSFVFTASQSISNGNLNCQATYTDSSLKPITRQPGSTNNVNVHTVSISPTSSGADIVAYGTMEPANAAWLSSLYMCG